MDYLIIKASYNIINFKYSLQNNETLNFFNSGMKTNLMDVYLDGLDNEQTKSVKFLNTVIYKHIGKYIHKIDSFLPNKHNFIIYYIVNNKKETFNILNNIKTQEQIPNKIFIIK